MSRLLHDRYWAYASSHAWDLTTGERVRVDAIAADDAEPPAPAWLVEVLDHGREGESRWVVANNANGPRSPLCRRCHAISGVAPCTAASCASAASSGSGSMTAPFISDASSALRSLNGT